MGALWDVGISVQSNTDRASIVVTSRPAERADAVALADLDGTTYFAVLAEDDPALADAMRSFLAASLQVRCPLAGGGPAAPGQAATRTPTGCRSGPTSCPSRRWRPISAWPNERRSTWPGGGGR